MKIIACGWMVLMLALGLVTPSYASHGGSVLVDPDCYGESPTAIVTNNMHTPITVLGVEVSSSPDGTLDLPLDIAIETGASVTIPIDLEPARQVGAVSIDDLIVAVTVATDDGSGGIAEVNCQDEGESAPNIPDNMPNNGGGGMSTRSLPMSPVAAAFSLLGFVGSVLLRRRERQ